MRRYNQRMFRIAVGFGIPNDDCEDLIQIAHIAAFEKLNQFEGKAKFSTWLIKILINECLMFKRKMKTESSRGKRPLSDADKYKSISKSKTPEDHLEEKELKELLEKAITNLPEKYRTIYLMKEVEGLSLHEVAQCLGITEINVKVRSFRAKSMLKDFLSSEFGNEDIFPFGNERCDRVVNAVMTKIFEIGQSKSKSF